MTRLRLREPSELRELYDRPERRVIEHMRPDVALTIWKAGRAFRHGALDAAAPYISFLRRDPRNASLEQVEELAWRLRVVSRVIFGLQLCLFECVTVCSAMRWLGYQAEIVVAHTTTPQPGNAEVHAWLAMGSEPILEAEAIQFYFEVARYPRDFISPAAGTNP